MAVTQCISFSCLPWPLPFVLSVVVTVIVLLSTRTNRLICSSENARCSEVHPNPNNKFDHITAFNVLIRSQLLVETPAIGLAVDESIRMWRAKSTLPGKLSIANTLLRLVTHH